MNRAQMYLDLFEKGQWPWSPNHNARIVTVYDQFNVPTVGLVDVAGTQFLFSCIAGHGRNRSIWAYVEAPPTGSAVWHQTAIQGFDAWFEHLIEHQPAIYATATEVGGIEYVRPGRDIELTEPLADQAIDALGILPSEAPAFGLVA